MAFSKCFIRRAPNKRARKRARTTGVDPARQIISGAHRFTPDVMRKTRSRSHPPWISKSSAQFATLRLSPKGRGFERSQGCERRTAGALEKTKGPRHGQTHGRHSARSRDPLVRSIGNRQTGIQDKALHHHRVRECTHSPSALTIVIIRPR